MKTHTREQLIQCPEYSYATSFTSSLKTHLRTNSGEKPYEYQCQYECQCPYAAGEAGHLRTNMKHIQKKSYINVHNAHIVIYRQTHLKFENSSENTFRRKTIYVLNAHIQLVKQHIMPMKTQSVSSMPISHQLHIIFKTPSENTFKIKAIQMSTMPLVKQEIWKDIWKLIQEENQ